MSFKVKDEVLRRSCEWTSKCIVFLALSSSFSCAVPSLTLFIRYAPYPPYRFLSLCAVPFFLLAFLFFSNPPYSFYFHRTLVHIYISIHIYTHTHPLSFRPYSVRSFLPSFPPPFHREHLSFVSSSTHSHLHSFLASFPSFVHNRLAFHP